MSKMKQKAAKAVAATPKTEIDKHIKTTPAVKPDQNQKGRGKGYPGKNR